MCYNKYIKEREGKTTMKRYWVGTMNRVTTTIDKEMPKDEGWIEVTEEAYEKAYTEAWNNACNSFWHC